MEFTITDNIKKEDEEAIFRGLKEYNDANTEELPKDLGIYLEDESGGKLAGLVGLTLGNWLHVSYLWVSSEMRGQGVGSRLLKQAEETAQQRGCKYVFLDTFSFQAPAFYEKYGYQEILKLDEYPRTGSRHYYVKELPVQAPDRQDYLDKVTVGGRTPHNAAISLCDYDPQWRILFQQEKKQLDGILRENALRIEHVGSTSVPGLCAKPVIDMLLVVVDSSDEASYVPALEEAGYTLRIREPDWFEHRMFKGPGADINLHVFSHGAAEIERMLLFRDWLRTHGDDRQLYAKAKRELAAQTWQHVQDYADAKTDVITEIMKRVTGQ